jgi:hypothetical protein
MVDKPRINVRTANFPAAAANACAWPGFLKPTDLYSDIKIGGSLWSAASKPGRWRIQEMSLSDLSYERNVSDLATTELWEISRNAFYKHSAPLALRN